MHPLVGQFIGRAVTGAGAVLGAWVMTRMLEQGARTVRSRTRPRPRPEPERPEPQTHTERDLPAEAE